MRVLVTRPEPDAAPLAAELKRRGHDVLIQPLLTIRTLPQSHPLALEAVQALLFTSANGVRAFEDLSQERDLPVFTVGDASARAAREAGFQSVESAGGTVEDLARLAARRLEPHRGPLFHGAASDLAGDLKILLKAEGYVVKRAVLYRAEAVERFSPEVQTALQNGTLDIVLFFSPRTAVSFLRVIEAYGLKKELTGLWALCLSVAVAERLAETSWAGVQVAERPCQESLLKGLDALAL